MAIKKEHKDLPLVPESVLKKRHDLDDIRRRNQGAADPTLIQHQKRQQKRRVQKKGRYVKKPETYLAEAKSRRNELARYKRVKKKGMQKRASNVPETQIKEIPIASNANDATAAIDSDEEDALEVDIVSYQSNSVGANYVFAIRIREDSGKVPKKIFDMLHRLRLKTPNTGVFLKYDELTRRHLHLVEPWVVYGKPTEGIVKDLLERKSFGILKGGNGEKVPLSDNTILERELGNEHGIICMEDMVHELTNVGDAFDAVTKFLVPFPLSATRSRFEKEKLKLKQGKDYGDKGEGIDEYIKQML